MFFYLKGVASMRETKIMKVFENYVKRFDMKKGNVKAMYFHSIKMMELCKDIASNLGIFSDEEVIVCGLIGLFHDISMFSNKNKNCIVLDDGNDYTRDTIELMFDSNKLIREITKENKYDNIIKIAIYCHNKSGLPKGIDKKILHYCMVVKDAHVIENFRMLVNYPYMDMHIDNLPNSLVYNDFRQYKVINARISDNDADKILEVMSSIFGVYYAYSYYLIKEESCVNKLYESLYINDRNIKKFFMQIVKVLNLYVDRKIGVRNA